jgi:hypothetical protein
LAAAVQVGQAAGPHNPNSRCAPESSVGPGKDVDLSTALNRSDFKPGSIIREMIRSIAVGKLDGNKKVWIGRIRSVIRVLDCGEVKLVPFMDTLGVGLVARIGVLDNFPKGSVVRVSFQANGLD